jgi:hypothetical protein
MTLIDEVIGPTPERLAKAGDDIEETSATQSQNWRAIRMLDGHVIERLRNRDAISGDLYNAGCQFYSDWYHAGLASSGVIDPSREVVDGGQSKGVSDRRLAAMTRWQRAVQAVGKVHSLVLIDVILHEMTLELYGRKHHGYKAQKQAVQAAQTSLINALTELDYHYYGQRNGRTVAAHVAGYRPNISAS